jgi:hypothetical protein
MIAQSEYGIASGRMKSMEDDKGHSVSIRHTTKKNLIIYTR